MPYNSTVSIAFHGTDTATLAELGSRLRRHRIRRELTQRDLAHEAGVSIDTVKRLEAGRPVGTDNLLRMLRVLGLGEALDQALPEPPPSPLERLARQGAERQRVRHPTSRTRRAPRWTWGDDDSPQTSPGR